MNRAQGILALALLATWTVAAADQGTTPQPATPRPRGTGTPVSARPVWPTSQPAAKAARRAEAGPSRDQLLQQAAEAAAAGQRAEAARLYAQAADRYQSVQALLLLARLRTGERDPRAAFESLNRARQLAPNSEEVLSAYSQLALATGALLPAVATLESLARMCPTVGQYHYWLGIGLMQAGDMTPALEALKRAQELEPDKPLTLTALGLAMNVRKMYDEARTVLLHSLERDATILETVAALAEAEAGLGNLDTAEAYAQRVLAKAPDNSTANLAMGSVLMQRGKFAEAIPAFQAAIAAEPTNARPYYQLSLAYARTGDEAAAQKYVELYKKKLDEMEELVNAVRRETGFTSGGMGR